MRGTKTRWSLALLCALPLLPACIELEGQRITLRYDGARDRLTAILCYDGIHDFKADDLDKSIAKLREFVESGDVMLVDWYGVFDWSELFRPIEDPDPPEVVRAFLRAFQQNLTVTTLGHYRDPRGRIGAAQRIDIDHAKELIALANRAIDAAVIEDLRDQEACDPFEARRLAAARAGWTWLSLDGHALVGNIPVPEGGWPTLRHDLMRSFTESWAEQQSRFEEGDRDSPDAAIAALAAFSIDQKPGVVTIRLGYREEPTTVRVALRRGYKDNLAATVTSAVSPDLDQAVAEHLLDADGTLPSGLEDLPPEDRVRAMLRAREGSRRDAADGWLMAFRERWRDEQRIPAAPTSEPAEATWADDWAAWYSNVLRAVE